MMGEEMEKGCDRREPQERLDRIATAVIGAAIEVHRTLGPGYLESIYERALCVELGIRGLGYARQVRAPLVYKGVDIGEHFIDMVVEDCLIVELKACESLAPVHKAQVISYLKARGLTLGLLINFNVVLLKEGINRVNYSSQ